MKVIVTDADDKKAIAAIRCLGQRGVTVCAAGPNRWNQGLHSRYASKTLVYPNPVTRADEYAAFMLDFVSRHKFDCLLPMSDYTCLAASKHKDEFEKHVRIPVPDLAVARLARDKLEMTRTAERLNIGVPETHCPSSPEELADLARRIPYPCVLKFRKGTGAIGVRYPATPDELMELYSAPRRPDAVFEDLAPLVQEYIPGEIHDVCVLFNNGRPRAAMTQMRLKMWPRSGGRGIVDVTTDEPELRDAAFRLLGEIKWHGPAQVEFKIDSRDGRPKLMEINSRFWGGVDVMIQAGIDVPYLAAKMAVEGDIEPEFAYRVGFVYRWPFPHLFAQIFREEHKLKALREFLLPPAGSKSDLQLSDPLPHIIGSAYSAYVSFRRFIRL